MDIRIAVAPLRSRVATSPPVMGGAAGACRYAPKTCSARLGQRRAGSFAAHGLVAAAGSSSAATATEAAPSKIGTVRGYRYVKRNDAMQLGLTGELVDSFDTEWFVDFEQSTEIRRGDLLKFGDDDTRRVCSVRGGVANIYKLYRLEVA